MDAIGTRAGLSGPAIYRIFSGKDEILATLLHETLDHLIASSTVVSDDPQRDLEDLIRHEVEVTVENQDGFRDAYVLDLVALPGRRDVIRALLGEAVRFFRKAGVPLVRYRYLESPTSPQSGDLLRFGFLPRSKGRRNRLLVKFADPGRHKMACHITNWSYSIGDGEATFWVKLS